MSGKLYLIKLLVMLILILILYMANVHTQDIQIRSSEGVAGKNRNCSTFFRREILNNQIEPYKIQIPDISGNIVKYMKYLVFGDSQREDFEIFSKMNNYLNTDEESFAENGIQFDRRRREDAYKKTDPKAFPYTVGLLILNLIDGEIEPSSCSGSLLTAEWVLTSKHCVEESENVTVFVYAGGNSLDEVVKLFFENKSLPLSSQLIASIEFFFDDKGYDIALIKLPEKFFLTDTVNTIQLSSEPWNHTGYQKCVTTAFGRVSFEGEHEDDYSRKTHELEVKSPCLCNFLMKTVVDLTVPGVLGAQSFLCSKPRMDFGVCGGDSGGGLVCDGLVVAVNMLIYEFEDVIYCETGNVWSSWFSLKHSCGSKDTLSVFQLICPSLPWINQHVKLFENTSECWNLQSDGTLVTFHYWNIATGMLLPFIIII